MTHADYLKTDQGKTFAAQELVQEDRIPSSPSRISRASYAGPRNPAPRRHAEESGRLLAAETRAKGVVSLSVLMAYAKALGGLNPFLQV